jgi:predicted DNA-binding protein (MmcQ/YjbR family)
MVSFETFKQIALSFPNAHEQAHFEKPSFRVGKKIFATYDARENQICLKLNEIDQSVFSAFDPATIFPVPNKWGKQGWTLFKLAQMREDLLTDALSTAYKNVAPKSSKNL